MHKKKMLLILGGLRIGDTFHIIPFLRQACKEYHVHWIHGQYATPAVEFIRDHIVGMDISNEARPELKSSIPVGYPDVKEFVMRNMQGIDISEYDVALPPNSKSIHVNQWTPELACPKMTDTQFNIGQVNFDHKKDSIVTVRDFPSLKDHIVVQPTTVSSWKCSNELYSLNSNLFEGRTVYNVGAVSEKPITGPKVIIKNGATFAEVAQLMLSARFTIALHSAIACLAYHLGIPFICVSFGVGFLPFHKDRPNVVQITKPTLPELQKCIRDFIQRPYMRIEEGTL